MPHDVIFKGKKEDQRLVFAEVYAPDRPDSDGEFMDAATIAKMAYDFMKDMKLDQIDTGHSNNLVDGACIVESFIARKNDPDFIEGAWVVGVYIGDEAIWEKIKKGEINGFSVEAIVNKHIVNVEMSVPPILSGKTMKASAEDDHLHTFYVAYDENGRFMGGRTDNINGHFHVIKRGTLTEVANEHQHKFSHIEDVSLKEIEA